MKTEWKKDKLGNLCEITSSKRFHLSERAKTGIPFYCTKEILLKLKGETDFECDYIAEKFYEDIKSKFGVPQTDDLLLTTRGTVGYPYLYKQSDRFYFADGNLSWFKNFSKELDSHFLYFWFLSNEGKAKVDSIAKGTAQKAVPITGLGTLDILLPPLETQQKIAGILSAYDDLIENNRKQIKLLEEAAQKLYKEWFIKLNFPGHENVKVVDDVPDGWKKGTLIEIGEFKRGKTITKDQTVKGNVPVVAGGLEPAYYHNEANTEAPVITVSGSGANAGFTRLYYEKIWASDCSFLDISKCKNIFFIYCVLKSSTDIINNLQKGAAQPHVYAKDLNALPVLIPTDTVFDSFSKVVSPYFEKIKSLQKQIQLLQSARDKLLLRLMNGDINV